MASECHAPYLLNSWLQVVRLQNVCLFGAYLSRKQQLVAGGVALTEVVRFVGVARHNLRALCTRGMDARRLGGHVTYFGERVPGGRQGRGRPQTPPEQRVLP
jgi:hypothetical protein